MRKIEIDEYELFYSVRILGKDEFIVHFNKSGSPTDCMAIRFGEYGFYRAEEFQESFPNEMSLAKAYFDTYRETEQEDFFRGMTRQYKD